MWSGRVGVMGIFIFRRIFIEEIPTLFAIVTITSFLYDWLREGLLVQKNVSPQVLERLNVHYGLDKPLIIQYQTYLINVLKGDFGPSFKGCNRKCEKKRR